MREAWQLRVLQAIGDAVLDMRKEVVNGGGPDLGVEKEVPRVKGDADKWLEMEHWLRGFLRPRDLVEEHPEMAVFVEKALGKGWAEKGFFSEWDTRNKKIRTKPGWWAKWGAQVGCFVRRETGGVDVDMAGMGQVLRKVYSRERIEELVGKQDVFYKLFKKV